MYYNRYEKFIENGDMAIIPYIKLINKSSDKTKTWNKGNDRLDDLSYRYYGNAEGRWLIMWANPQYGSDEFLIPDKALIRIPFPFKDSVNQFVQQMDRYIKRYREI